MKRSFAIFSTFSSLAFRWIWSKLPDNPRNRSASPLPLLSPRSLPPPCRPNGPSPHSRVAREATTIQRYDERTDSSQWGM